MPVDPLLREVVAYFAVEAAERAAVIARSVLALERGEGDLTEAWSTLKRELHTLKGSAATAGLDEAAALAHRLETVLAAQPRDKVLAPAAASELLTGTDTFVALVRAEAAPEQAAAPPSADGPDDDDDGADAVVTSPSTAGGDDDHASWRVRSDDVLALMRDIERLRELRLRIDERAREVDGALAAAVEPRVRDALHAMRRGLMFDADEAGDVIASLEETVKAVTTLPLRTILEPLHRVVRDVCAATGKKASLSIVGAGLAIDRRLLEGLRGPLIQLVRNAVDHGVEAPAERTQRGKHDVGAIVVRAEQEGNLLFVEVSDDGGGMSAERLQAEAVRLGILDKDATLTRDEVLRLAFHQGLSTKSEVSETSGRGVGLDVVAREIRALHGGIDVTSRPGQGTRFLVHLPIDLGSSPILLVKVGEHVLGLPMLAVEGVAAATPSTVVEADGALHLDHRGRRLPVHDLGALLAVRSPSPPARGSPLVVVHEQGRRLALSVDTVIGDRDLVVRPLPSQLAELPAWQGAAVLARGDLVLVVRPDWLAAREEEKPLEPVATRRVLVVDDSLTARALHRTILEAGGYDVHTVASVEVAEEELRRARYDVVVSDLTFALGMKDGLDLLRSVRESPSTGALAFVLVTMADDEEVHTHAKRSGCDVCLTKKECASGRLLAEVSAVLTTAKSA